MKLFSKLVEDDAAFDDLLLQVSNWFLKWLEVRIQNSSPKFSCLVKVDKGQGIWLFCLLYDAIVGSNAMDTVNNNKQS